MEAKKVNIFAFLMIIVMCVFSIYISTNNNRGIVGKDGKDGADGSDMTIVSLYNDYKEQNPNYLGSLSDFIEHYLGDLVAGLEDEITKASLSAQSALCSTVDICYSYKMDSYYYLEQDGFIFSEDNYAISIVNQPKMSVSAGSGVIYKMIEEGTKKTAYIITNYHVAYVSAYSNNPNYSLIYNSKTGNYHTGTLGQIYQYSFYNYIKLNEIQDAPVETHFLDSYSIYLNGYQSKDNALSASFVGGSAENDIAVLKVEYDSAVDENHPNSLIFNGNYAEAILTNSDSISESDYVVAVGNPLIPNTNDINMSQITSYDQYLNAIEEAYINSLCLTTTGGRISQITCEMPFTSIIDSTQVNNMRLIQVDAAINPGNSGGGLFDLNGKLVGIVNGKIADSSYDNVGFAIPINIASRIADQIIAQCDETSTISIYRLKTAGLGLELIEVAGETNKPTFDGVWNYKYDIVVENIPSAGKITSGIFEIGDILVSIEFEGNNNEYFITRDYQLDDLLLLAKYPSNQSSTIIKFNIIRNGQEKEIVLTFSSSNFEKIV